MIKWKSNYTYANNTDKKPKIDLGDFIDDHIVVGIHHNPDFVILDNGFYGCFAKVMSSSLSSPLYNLKLFDSSSKQFKAYLSINKIYEALEF